MRRVLLALLLASMIAVAGCAGGPAATDTETTAPGDRPTDTPDETTTDAPGGDEPTDRSGDSGTPSTTPGSEDPTDTADSGDPGDTTGGETSTDASTGEDPTDTPGDGETASGSEEGLPPGVDGSTVTNATALREAHYEALSGSSFRIDVSETGGPEPLSFTIHNGTGAIRLDLEEVGGDTVNRFYITENVTTGFNSSQTPPKTYSYGSTGQQFGALFLFAILFGSYPGQQLSVGTFEVDGTVSQNGEELIRLSVTGVNETAVEESGFTSSEATLTDMAGEVLVRSDGLVREMRLQQRFESGATSDLSFAVSGLGSTSATEPDWIDEAPRIEGSLSDDGTVMALSHTGGPEVPAGTTLTLASGGFGGGIAPTNVTLPTSLGAGDSVYLYATGSLRDPTVEVSAEVPSPGDALNLSRASPQVSGTLGEVEFVIGVPDQDDDG